MRCADRDDAKRVTPVYDQQLQAKIYLFIFVKKKTLINQLSWLGRACFYTTRRSLDAILWNRSNILLKNGDSLSRRHC